MMEEKSAAKCTRSGFSGKEDRASDRGTERERDREREAESKMQSPPPQTAAESSAVEKCNLKREAQENETTGKKEGR